MGFVQAIVRLLPHLSEGEALARMAAPLWARVGRTVTLGDLHGAKKLLGEEGDRMLHEVLAEAGALKGDPPILQAEPLAAFLYVLVTHLSGHINKRGKSIPKLVWTLPTSHPFGTEAGRSYARALVELIDLACSELVLVAPFVEKQGIEFILDALLRALGRGVHVKVLAHNLEDISSVTSHVLEVVRQAAERLQKGSLCVYTAGKPGSLLHAKLLFIPR